jgi:uncharacterized C2H2 Zn-finger protein
MLNRKQLEDTVKERDIYGCPNCQKLHDDKREISQTALTTLHMLKRLEWSKWSRLGEEYMNYCPMCDNSYRIGHKPDCELGKLLREVDG